MSIATHDRIPEAALDWLRAGKGAALATVIETWGSAPRPRGSQLAINAHAARAPNKALRLSIAPIVAPHGELVIRALNTRVRSRRHPVLTRLGPPEM